jgi:hypothetical protein
MGATNAENCHLLNLSEKDMMVALDQSRKMEIAGQRGVVGCGR